LPAHPIEASRWTDIRRWEDEMNQQNRSIGVPGGRPDVNGTHRPAVSAQAHQATTGAHQPANIEQQAADTDELLQGVENQLEQLNGTSPQEQVLVFDRMHTALADALARTADTGGPPPPGESGA
jgi:hypothetical protein